MSRRRIVVLTAAAGAIAAAAIVAFATMGQAGPGPGPDPDPKPADEQSVVHKVTEDPKDVEDYWTEERMRDAEPAPMPTLDAEPERP